MTSPSCVGVSRRGAFLFRTKPVWVRLTTPKFPVRLNRKIPKDNAASHWLPAGFAAAGRCPARRADPPTAKAWRPPATPRRWAAARRRRLQTISIAARPTAPTAARISNWLPRARRTGQSKAPVPRPEWPRPHGRAATRPVPDSPGCRRRAARRPTLSKAAAASGNCPARLNSRPRVKASSAAARPGFKHANQHSQKQADAQAHRFHSFSSSACNTASTPGRNASRSGCVWGVMANCASAAAKTFFTVSAAGPLCPASARCSQHVAADQGPRVGRKMRRDGDAHGPRGVLHKGRRIAGGHGGCCNCLLLPPQCAPGLGRAAQFPDAPPDNGGGDPIATRQKIRPPAPVARATNQPSQLQRFQAPDTVLPGAGASELNFTGAAGFPSSLNTGNSTGRPSPTTVTGCGGIVRSTYFAVPGSK